MRTAADPHGRTVLGTLNNCASGMTPWGTYLSGEENFAFYFDGGERARRPAPLGPARKQGYRWAEHDERFDAKRHPNEFHRFGWIVEIDPLDPASVPVKRTALGRAAHEGAWVATTRDGRAVVYSGEDARFEYIYKFVSRDRIAPGGAKANRELLDHGTLYVARFDADGTGRWLPLVHGPGAADGRAGFPTRARCDPLPPGERPARRDEDGPPEWLAIDPAPRTVYCTLTNNSARGTPGRPGVDAANPRANNTMGHVIRWTEDGDFDATTFRWSTCCWPATRPTSGRGARRRARRHLRLPRRPRRFDARGVLWMQTDASTLRMHRASSRASATTRCSPATCAPARCGAS
jgi:uncharacterized protein